MMTPVTASAMKSFFFLVAIVSRSGPGNQDEGLAVPVQDNPIYLIYKFLTGFILTDTNLKRYSELGEGDEFYFICGLMGINCVSIFFSADNILRAL